MEEGDDAALKSCDMAYLIHPPCTVVASEQAELAELVEAQNALPRGPRISGSSEILKADNTFTSSPFYPLHSSTSLCIGHGMGVYATLRAADGRL